MHAFELQVILRARGVYYLAQRRAILLDRRDERGMDNSAPRASVPEPVTIDDLAMPAAVVRRIARRRLPDGTNIQRDAMSALTRCATMTVSYLAAA